MSNYFNKIGRLAAALALAGLFSQAALAKDKNSGGSSAKSSQAYRSNFQLNSPQIQQLSGVKTRPYDVSKQPLGQVTPIKPPLGTVKPPVGPIVVKPPKGPIKWPVDPVGPVVGPVKPPKGPIKWPVDPVGPVVGPVKPPKGPIKWPVDPVGPVVGPVKPPKGPIKWPVDPVGPVVGPVKPPKGPIKWPVDPVGPIGPVKPPVDPPADPPAPPAPPATPPCDDKDCHNEFPWQIFLPQPTTYYPSYPQTVVVTPAAPAPIPVAATGNSDLMLEDVQFVEPATMLVGPAYRVKFRNQGQDSTVDFRVGLVATTGGAPTDKSPQAVVQVSGLAGGQVGEVTIRLPKTAMTLLSTTGQTSAFTRLLVAVDFENKVSESDKSNNVAELDRSQLEAAAR